MAASDSPIKGKEGTKEIKRRERLSPTFFRENQESFIIVTFQSTIHLLSITEYLVHILYNAGDGVIQLVKVRKNLHPLNRQGCGM